MWPGWSSTFQPRKPGFTSATGFSGWHAPTGSYAEYTAVPTGGRTEPLARIPDSVPDDQAAALPVAAIAALGSLELLALAPGQRLVVMGAAGGVGGYAVQMAVARGARVIATVRGDVDASEARRLGAEDVYDVDAVDAVHALRESHPDGVDAVLDIVNGPAGIKRDAGRAPCTTLSSPGSKPDPAADQITSPLVANSPAVAAPA